MPPLELTEASILRVQPGDVILLKVAEGRLSMENREILFARWQHATQGTPIENAKVFILDGLDVEVLRADADEWHHTFQCGRCAYVTEPVARSAVAPESCPMCGQTHFQWKVAKV